MQVQVQVQVQVHACILVTSLADQPHRHPVQSLLPACACRTSWQVHARTADSICPRR